MCVCLFVVVVVVVVVVVNYCCHVLESDQLSARTELFKSRIGLREETVRVFIIS